MRIKDHLKTFTETHTEEIKVSPVTTSSAQKTYLQHHLLPV